MTSEETRERAHDLKCWPPFYEAVESGAKPFEVRWDDRGFAVGDVLRLREWTGTDYTGRSCVRTVTFVLAGGLFDIPEGIVVLGLEDERLRVVLKERDEAVEERDNAQQETRFVLVALGEPCAECGHIDWRADDVRIDAYRSRLLRAEEALREIDQWNTRNGLGYEGPQKIARAYFAASPRNRVSDPVYWLRGNRHGPADVPTGTELRIRRLEAEIEALMEEVELRGEEVVRLSAEREKLREALRAWEDDVAILAGCAAVSRLLMLRVGGQTQHAAAFRDAALVQQQDGQ